MKIFYSTCLLLCILFILNACNKESSSIYLETPKPTEKAMATFLTTPTATAEPTPTATPPTTKPEIVETDRQTMLSDLNAFLDTVKISGDIFTVSYVDDVALSGRYYAK